mmetsp:Transcript_7699/g.22845  ORF Transcript_7699/g.22845 Transcript_7699/m.22845 type:complete len:503 (+) Transcript_7699:220-1728(+)
MCRAVELTALGSDNESDDAALDVAEGDAPKGRAENHSAEAANDAAPAEFSRAGVRALCFGMFANSVALTNPFPYAGFMVLHYGLTRDPSEVGFYAGWIMTSFMLGRTLSSFVCGAISDRRGRKIVVRVGLWSCVVFQLCFGLSPTFALALGARLCMGLFNGMTGVSKAAIPELVPESERQTAMGYVAGTWNAGQVFGPAVGGLLAERSFGLGLLRRFPYAMPNIIGAALAFVAVLVVERWLPDDSKGSGYSKLGANDDADDDDVAPAKGGVCSGVPRASWTPIVVYCALSFLTIFFDDAYPLWCLTPRAEGGMAMDAGQIGVNLSATAVVSVLYQFLVFPSISARCGPRTLFPLSTACAAGLMLVPQFIARMAPVPAPATWAALLVHSVLQRVMVSNCFTAMFCLINESCEADQRGKVNGVAMSIASGVKAAGPSAGSMSYAYALARTPSHAPVSGAAYVFGGASLAMLLTAAVAWRTMRPPPADVDGGERMLDPDEDVSVV